MKLLRITQISLVVACLLSLVAIAGTLLSNFITSSSYVTPPQTTGRALIGGPFTLTDHSGARVSEQTFAGQFTLIFFGYTYCPDVCPTELQTMTDALGLLGQKAERVTPIFVTVDPERDTVEQMASYVANFHSRLVGLTGTEQDIRDMAKTFRIYYAKAENYDPGTDYLMSHSSIVYLMGPTNEFLTHFSHGTNAREMADGIEKHL
ncbi:MAG: SCO family protein [Geminicoccales bacterium]